MALLGNYSIILKNPVTFIGGTQVSNCRSAFNMEGQMLQMYYGESEGGGLPLTASLDTGTEPPYSWHLAEKGGELSATTTVYGSGALSGTMILTRDLAANLAGTGTLEGSLALITNLIATLAGSGTLGGALSLSLAMSASIGGTGSLSGSMGLLINMIASLAGSGAITGNLTGVARLEANIYVNSGTATTQEIVDAILNAIAADYNLAGTIGEAINGAGSAGNPWITDLSAYNTANTAGKILKDRLSKGQFIALK